MMSPPLSRALPQREFIALMAMVSASVAFSIDAMLPALPEMAEALTPDNINLAQLIVTSFLLGLGIGTMFTGPLSDAYGRKPVLIGGTIVYVLGSAIAWQAQTLEVMLFARVIQGLGSAGPRVVAMALIRDLYAGPQMARILSFVMVIFTLVPAMAPTLGHYIIEAFNWEAIFVACMLFSVITSAWLMIRQPETLTKENQRPLSATSLWSALIEMFSHPTARLSILIQTLTFAMLYGILSSTQPIFELTYGQGEKFHLWFGGIALLASLSGFLNAQIVVKVGMRAIIKTMYTGQIFMTVVLIIVLLLESPAHIAFPVYLLWVLVNFFQAGMTIGNLNALGMEEMGHMAGLAASVLTSVATVGGVILAVPIALLFDGTPLPVAVGALLMAFVALWLTNRIKRPGES